MCQNGVRAHQSEIGPQGRTFGDFEGIEKLDSLLSFVEGYGEETAVTTTWTKMGLIDGGVGEKRVMYTFNCNLRSCYRSMLGRLDHET
jgi:hypothetical protein